MKTIDLKTLKTVTGGATFDERFAAWLKLTEGKSAQELLRLPGPPRP